MKSIVKDLSEVPEPLRTEYEEKDGAFVLKLDGDHPVVATVVQQANAKVSEFRENNIRLMKDLETAGGKLKAYEGIDPDEYRRLKQTTDDFKQKGVQKGEDIQALIERAINPLREELLSEKKARADAAKALERKTLESALAQAGQRAGVQDSALPDFLSRGMQMFELENGRPVPKKDGAPVYSKERPGEFMSPEEWAGNLQKEAAHLFKPNAGAGSTGSGAPSGANAPKRLVNPTPLEFGRHLADIKAGKVIVVHE